MHRRLWPLFSALLTINLSLALVQWVTIQAHASYALITLVSGVGYLCYWLGAAWWGRYADRHGAGATTRSVLALELAGLAALGAAMLAWPGYAIVWAALCAILIGIVRPGNDAGNFRYVAEWRDRSRKRQLGRHLISFEGAARTGAALAAGALVAWLSANHALSLLFVLPLTGLLAHRSLAAPTPARPTALAPWNGLASLWRMREVRGTVGAFMAYNCLAIGSVTLMLPWLTLEAGIGPALAGAVLTLGGALGIAASSLLPPLVRGRDYHRTAILGYAGISALGISFAASLHSPPAAAAIAAVMIAFTQAVIALGTSWRQDHVDTAVMARFAVTARSIQMFTGALGVMGAGTFYTLLGSNPVRYAAFCQLTALAVIVACLSWERRIVHGAVGAPGSPEQLPVWQDPVES
jgi:MFS family permease